MCSLKNVLWLLRYVGRPTPKMIKGVEKTATNVKINPTNWRGMLKERERPQTLYMNLKIKEGEMIMMKCTLITVDR